MLRKIVFLFLLVSCHAAHAGVIKSALDSFSKVSFIGNYQVKLVKSDSNFIYIDNKDTANVPDSDIIFELVNNELKVHVKQDLLSEKQIFITLYYQAVEQITARRGVKVEGTGVVTDSLKVIASTGTKINLGVSVKHLNASLSSGGAVRLHGVAQSATYSVHTGGTIGASFMEVKAVKANVKLGGEIILNAGETLEIDITAGGTVSYRGNPIIKSQSIKLGGTIENIEKTKDDNN